MDLTPKQIEDAMLTAYTRARLSPDPSTQNGAVLLTKNWNEQTKSWEIYRSVGHNHPVAGLPTENWTPERQRLLTTHAEEDAILAAAFAGYSTCNSTLVCPWACCEKCATTMLGAGVTKLIVHKDAMERPSDWSQSISDAMKLLSINGVQVDIWESPPQWQRPKILYRGELW